MHAHGVYVTLWRATSWVALLGASAACNPAPPLQPPQQQARAKAAPPSKLHLCWLEQGESSSPWREQWTAALAYNLKQLTRLYPKSAQDDSLTFESACSTQPNRVCDSEPGAVYCRIDTLGRSLNAIALASASYDVQSVNRSPDLPPLPLDVRLSLTPAMASSFGENALPQLLASFPHPTFERHLSESSGLSEHIRTLVATGKPGGTAAHLPWAAYVVASNDLVAFLIGREQPRAHGRCLVDTASPLEADGTFQALVDLQKSGSICGNENLSDLAVEADRCGLRMLARMDASMADPLRERYKNDSLRGTILLPFGIGRRLAIDAFATLDIAAIRDSSDNLREDVQARDDRRHSLTQRGLLNEQLRLFLFAATLQRREDLIPSTVRLCGRAALRFAVALQHDTGRCGADLPSTRLATLFGQALSPKVTERWLRQEELEHTLKASAFLCAPEKYCFSSGPCPFTLL